MRSSLLTLLLPLLALAHPPHDADFEDPAVVAAAAAAAASQSASDWRLVSVQTQLVSGMNYFLVMAMKMQSEPYATWRLCSCRVYTTFSGDVVDMSATPWQPEVVPAAAHAVPAEDLPASCSAELEAPSPLMSTAAVTVTVMSSGGGGMMGGGGGIASHDEYVHLREAWRLCGDGNLTQFVTATDRRNATMLLAIHAMPSPGSAGAGAGGTVKPSSCPQAAKDSTPTAVVAFAFGLACAIAGVWAHKKYAKDQASPAAQPQGDSSSSWELNDAAVRAGVSPMEAG